MSLQSSLGSRSTSQRSLLVSPCLCPLSLELISITQAQTLIFHHFNQRFELRKQILEIDALNKCNAQTIGAIEEYLSTRGQIDSENNLTQQQLMMLQQLHNDIKYLRINTAKNKIKKKMMRQEIQEHHKEIERVSDGLLEEIEFEGNRRLVEEGIKSYLVEIENMELVEMLRVNKEKIDALKRMSNHYQRIIKQKGMGERVRLNSILEESETLPKEEERKQIRSQRRDRGLSKIMKEQNELRNYSAEGSRNQHKPSPFINHRAIKPSKFSPRKSLFSEISPSDSSKPSINPPLLPHIARGKKEIQKGVDGSRSKYMYDNMEELMNMRTYNRIKEKRKYGR